MAGGINDPPSKHSQSKIQYLLDNGSQWKPVALPMIGGGLESTLTLKVLVTTIDAQWEGMRDVGSARYEPALLPPCLTIRVLSYSN